MARTTSPAAHTEAFKSGVIRTDMLKASQAVPRSTAETPSSSTDQPDAAAPSAAVPTIDYAAMATLSGNAVHAFLEAGNTMMKAMAEMNEEVASFANSRWREHVERSEALMKCSDPAAAFGLHVDFAQKATQQYLEEASRLMALATQLSGKCWEQLQSSARDAMAPAAAADKNEATAETPQTTH